MRSPFFAVLVLSGLVAGGASPEDAAGKSDAAPSGLRILARAPLDPAAVAGVTHPGEPLFRVGTDGWPLQADSGYVALRDAAAGLVYATGQLDAWRGGPPSPDAGRENWGQIDAFACLARAMRELRERVPDHAPVPIGHISGEHGGFPDLAGNGYSGHVSHQTGLHVNFMLPPLPGVHERVRAMAGEPVRWNRAELLTLLDVLMRHGARQVVTNKEVVDLDEARTARYPALSRLAAEPRPYAGGKLYFRDDGGFLVLFDAPGNHADHLNVVFWPGT